MLKVKLLVSLSLLALIACSSASEENGGSPGSGDGDMAGDGDDDGDGDTAGDGDGDGDGDTAGDGDGDTVGDGDGDGDTAGDGDGDTAGDGDGDGERAPMGDVLPQRFGFGVSSFGAVLDWPAEVAESHGIDWDYLYWYQLIGADDYYTSTKLKRADELGAIPVITHYQLLDRGHDAGYSGDNEWDVVIQAVQDPKVMRGYYDNVEWVMGHAADFGKPAIFQTEPDSTTWLRMFHTGESNDATQGAVSVASSGHPDLSDLPDTIAGYSQALLRLRDLYAPNVYMGLCEFDNRNGNNPEYSVKFIESLGAKWDILFTHHVVKYSTKDEGWWDAVNEDDQARFLTWISTITEATGLKYIHWQTVIGSSDYGLMPNYPSEERISDLVQAGSVANLFDLITLDGPPHSQKQHGYTSSPPTDHPAYNSLDKLAERLEAYYQDPIAVDWKR